MLILTRRVNQSITIGDDVTITVLGFQGGHVKLGIKAPKTIRVLRQEVLGRDRNDKGSRP